MMPGHYKLRLDNNIGNINLNKPYVINEMMVIKNLMLNDDSYKRVEVNFVEGDGTETLNSVSLLLFL